MLKPQDVIVALKIHVAGPMPFSALGASVGISASQAYSAVQRAIRCGILAEGGKRIKPVALLEMLVALKRFFPAEKGAITKGIPTAHSGPPLKDIVTGSQEATVVWPDPDGTTVGIAYVPLYKTVPHAAKSDNELYELLSLVDALRSGRAREVAIAKNELASRLGVTL